MHICKIAFDAFFDDTKQLVADGVRADIAHHISSASNTAQRSIALARGKKRDASLTSWLAAKYPLSYGHSGSTDCPTYKLLVNAVVRDDNFISSGLPNWDLNATFPSSLVDDLLRMSAPNSTSSTCPPVLRKGSFLPVLKIAHLSILDLLTHLTQDEKNSFLKSLFLRALKIFKINFFPMSKPSSRSGHSVGAPNTKPVWNSWGHLGLRDANLHPPLDNPSSSVVPPPVPPEDVALNNAVASDCNADWHTKSITLTSLVFVLNKTSLPQDFVSPSPANVPYVDLTYTWVRENYNGTNPIHHLALLVSIIIASSLLPNLFIPQNSKHLFANANSKEDVRLIYNSLDWVSKDRNGLSDRSIFISMFTT